MEHKNPYKRLNQKAKDFISNFDPDIKIREYIALPIPNNERQISFQRIMRFTLLSGQIFGLNPVMGISKNDPNKTRFTYYSGKYVYSVVSVIGQAVLVFFCLLKIYWEKNATLNSDSAIIFFACNCGITILFIKVAIEWPKLSRHISEIEAIDPTTDETLIWKCNITCIVIIFLAAVEHTLSDLSAISAAIACQPEKHPYEAYLMQNFYWVWVYIPYNIVLGLVTKFIAIQCTFNWNYADVFVICLCWYLTARLRQVNERLDAVKGQNVTLTFWRTMREDYTKTTNLVKIIDKLVGGIIFVSFASNLFSICFLILHSLEEGLKPTSLCNVPSEKRLLGGYEHAAFLLFSISFLILRCLAMSLMAARVNSTSNETVLALYDVPSHAFNIEVKRFIDQIHHDSVVLSGLHFFSVKRGTVLTIAATIVTYELVLIQFTGVKAS